MDSDSPGPAGPLAGSGPVPSGHPVAYWQWLCQWPGPSAGAAGLRQTRSRAAAPVAILVPLYSRNLHKSTAMPQASSLHDLNHHRATVIFDTFCTIHAALSVLESQYGRVAPIAEVALISAAARVRDRLILSDEINGAHILIQCDRSS